MARLNVAPSGSAAIPIHEIGARQAFSPVHELARLVSCCLLGESQFYVDGADIEARVRELAAQVGSRDIVTLALRARVELGLRHIPLLLIVTLAAREDGRSLVREASRTILRTPRDAMDLLALYWREGKKPVPASFKAAFRDGFARWTGYQIAKYATLTNVSVRLRDLLFLSCPKPTSDREALFKQLADDELRAPDTWEAALSVPGSDKRAVWERLLSEGKLGALALVRNLRNMESVGVEPALVRGALGAAKAADIWPWQALAAAREAPAYSHDLTDLMIRSADRLPRFPGVTGVLVDVSGSMDQSMSSKGTMTRIDAAAGLAVVLRQVCDEPVIGTFSNAVVALRELPRGVSLAQAISQSQPHSGTYLGAAVPAFCAHRPDLNRLIILTDEQSNDYVVYPSSVPTYVVNLASYQRGIVWQGPVTRVNGWSGGIVRYLAEQVAGAAVAVGEDEEAA